MAFWWVNHKQTVRQETEGGYVWSPKANANGARNASYDNLTRCQPGDVVYSYAYGPASRCIAAGESRCCAGSRQHWPGSDCLTSRHLHSGSRPPPAG